MNRARPCLIAVVWAAAQAPALAAEPDPELAKQAHAILKKYCYSCHGSTFKVPGYNVLDRDSLVAKPPAGKKRKGPYLIPGKPDESPLWKRVGIDEDMPPEDPSPSDEEKATLRRWIAAGAPFPVLDKARPFVGEGDVLKAIHGHLTKTQEADRRYQRYFTLTNLHNNRKVLDDDLRLYRAALAKLVNSLSWKPRIVVPAAIDPHETVYIVDLRDLGWDEGDLWHAIIRREEPRPGARFLGARDDERKGYPYGVRPPRDREDEIQGLAADIARLSGCELTSIRADWFIATASRPPIYEAVLGLPAHARDLERRLNVDVRANFLRDQLARAGFASSGVSSHNRMVEHHEAAFGAYWKSYDFKSDEGTAELPRYPLGPVFPDNPFERQAFEHAGGELIFNLPNKLQGRCCTNNSCFSKDLRQTTSPICGFLGGLLAVTS
jgi:cytochrome c